MAPTAMAPRKAPPDAFNGVKQEPSSKLTLPAASPFQNVNSTGEIPSIRAVILLSNDHNKQAAAAAAAAIIPASPELEESKMAAHVVPITPIIPNLPMCSLKRSAASTAVKG